MNRAKNYNFYSQKWRDTLKQRKEFVLVSLNREKNGSTGFRVCVHTMLKKKTFSVYCQGAWVSEGYTGWGE